MIRTGAHLRLSLDREVVVALWGPPRASRGILGARLERRVELGRGLREVGVPEGAAWGGVFDPEGDPPLLLGAFRALGWTQELRIAMDRWSGAALRGDGVMEPLGHGEFGRALREMAAAGLRLPEPEPYGPPFPLWWVRVGPAPVPPGEAARAPARAGDRPPPIPGALRFAADDPEYGGRLTPEALARYPDVREFPTERAVAHAPGARMRPERRGVPAPTRWVIAAAPDGSRLVILALRDPISGADRIVHAAMAPPGGMPAETDMAVFEHYYPGARGELGRALGGAPAPVVPEQTLPAAPGAGRGRWTLDRWLGGGGA
ncbi:MAG: hypothetical protein RXS42_07230 [Nitrososphaeria archaeon]